MVHKQLSFVITGILFKTHRELGISRNEKQYGDFFEGLLKKENINYKREFRFNDKFENGDMRCICDFVIDDKIILEFKVKDFITKEDYYQLKRYLESLEMQLGILVNFRQNRLSPKRVLNAKFLEKNSRHSD